MPATSAPTAAVSRRSLLAGLAGLALMPGRTAWASASPSASPWAEGQRSRVRLLDGGPEGAVRLAGLEIALSEGFKTYWRHPGDSGIPPTLDWSGSVNLAAAEVLWPAPMRFEDGGGTSFGYAGGVILPVRATPLEPDRPVALRLNLAYGVCKDICIPARADLALALAGTTTAEAGRIGDALRRVPRKAALGASEPLAVLAVAPVAGQAALTVEARAPAGAQLFVEGPEDWFLSAGEGVPQGSADGATLRFPVEIVERPKQPAGSVPLLLTLVSSETAVEVEAGLDAGALPR
ncbi:MAG TPA: protein-disulfide reductase DsbD domain-containing protein [Beijerinckiaceae bacterium]|jgi:DsbC/DsbD-like thiol-disulfide interchange protein